MLINESIAMIGRSKIWANTVPIQMRYIYLIMPIAFVAMVLVAVELILRNVIGLIQPKAPVARMPQADTDMAGQE